MPSTRVPLPVVGPVSSLPQASEAPAAHEDVSLQPSMPTFTVVNLGCPKNQVDGEGMQSLLLRSGYALSRDPRRADAVIVNTCGFIKPAIEESVHTIRMLAARKRPGQLLIVAGCLAQRLGEQLADDFPKVDGILGTLRWNEVVELVGELRQGHPSYWLGPSRAPTVAPRATRAPSAYLKISDGCDVNCAFCTIPTFKGRHRSKPADRIVHEARELVAQGVKEVVLIGQDTTDYGRDVGQRDGLSTLLDRLCDEVPELPWIRLMYAFPGRLTPRLLETIARRDQVLKYVDLPLQHASREVLARMGRPRHDLREVVGEIRAAIPDVAIRSAFIVGFPGETSSEFAELLAFLDDAQLDRVGVFRYSRESGTRAGEMADQVPERTKERRFRRAMAAQQRISLARNRRLVGRTLQVLVEGRVEAEGPGEPTPFRSVGRSYRDAPEVDGLVFVREDVPDGAIVDVKVVDAMAYDLVAELAATPAS